MDVNMPIMDGLETAKTIRQMEDLKETFIIAATSNDTVDDKMKCFESGMNSFIRKPYNKSEIAWALDLVKMRSRRTSVKKSISSSLDSLVV
jgi:CheY-like chemotaxis protein